jgi:hypothetical protein
MTTDSSQVMQVLDRCLDVAGTDSNAAPKVAAAAARAKADPDMHDAISQLLAEEQEASSWECWRRALATARKYESGDLVPCSRLQRCDTASPISQMFSSCVAASGAPGEPDSWDAAITLAELFLGIIMLEMTSLGTDEGRRLRNRAAHGDVAAALTQWRNLADFPPESRYRSKPR